MTVSVFEIVQLKKEVAERFSAALHACDSCGGQSFTVEHPTDELKAFITAFFAARQMAVVFSENGERFTVREALSR